MRWCYGCDARGRPWSDPLRLGCRALSVRHTESFTINVFGFRSLTLRGSASQVVRSLFDHATGDRPCGGSDSSATRNFRSAPRYLSWVPRKVTRRRAALEGKSSPALATHPLRFTTPVSPVATRVVQRRRDESCLGTHRAAVLTCLLPGRGHGSQLPGSARPHAPDAPALLTRTRMIGADESPHPPSILLGAQPSVWRALPCS